MTDKIDGRSREARLSRQQSETSRSPRELSLTETIEREQNKGGRSPRRTPLHKQGGVLDQAAALYQKPGKTLYWGIDIPGKLEARQMAGWEFVIHNGNKVTVPAGSGLNHYLLEIDTEYYMEDLEDERAQLRENESRHTKVNDNEYAGREVGHREVGDSAVKVERDLY